MKVQEVVFPTHVGVDRRFDHISIDVTSIPHARGGGPKQVGVSLIGLYFTRRSRLVFTSRDRPMFATRRRPVFTTHSRPVFTTGW